MNNHTIEDEVSIPGIHWNDRSQSYRVRIEVDKCLIGGASFSDFKEAVIERLRLEAQYYPELVETEARLWLIAHGHK